MNKLGAIENWVEALGGADEAAKRADQLLRCWQKEARHFGALNLVVSARAAVHMVAGHGDSTDLTEVSEAWLESRAAFCTQQTYEDLADIAVRFLADTGVNPRGLRAKLRRMLSLIWAESHNRRLAVPDLCFLVSDEDDNPSPELALDLAARLAASYPGLENRTVALRSMLRSTAELDSFVAETAGTPKLVLTAEQMFDAPFREMRIRIEATAAIWEEEMLDAGAAAVALGAKASNREKVRSLRNCSKLLGLPHNSRYLYPSFQIDLARRQVYDTVESVNQLLGAADDPWGVASWWMTENVLIQARPCDLVGGTRRTDVWRAACALVDADPQTDSQVTA